MARTVKIVGCAAAGRTLPARAAVYRFAIRRNRSARGRASGYTATRTHAGIARPARYRRTARLTRSRCRRSRNAASASGSFGRVNSYRPVAYRSSFGVSVELERTHTHAPARRAPVFSCRGTAVIMVVVVNIRIVYNGGTVVDIRAVSVVIPVNVTPVHVLIGQKYPIVRRHIDAHVDTHSRTHRRPTVISAPAPPGYPSGSPFVAGNPRPAVIIVIEPASVVKRCPSPREIRNPGIAVIGHYPISVRCIRMEIPTYSRYPYFAISAVPHPPAVTTQSVVENPDVYPTAVLVTAVGVKIIVVVIVIIILIIIIIVVVVITVISAVASL